MDPVDRLSETGLVSLVVWAKVFEAQRHTAVNAKMLVVHDKLHRHEGVTHVIADSFERLDTPAGLQPRSRDFH